MEEHTIKINIADRTYSQKVSQDMEADIRKAAREVDEVLREYSRMYSGVSQLDLATVIALNATAESIRLKEELEGMKTRLEQLNADLQGYVDTLK